MTKLQNFLPALAAAATLWSAPVLAADLMIDEAPVSAPASAGSWTGCYVGAGIGYVSQTVDNVLAADLFDGGSHDASGATFNARLGCDLQQGPLVFGILATGDFGDLTGSNAFYPVGPGFPEYNTTETDWLATLKGRVGIAVDDRLMGYVTGGVAWVHNTHTDYDTTPVTSFSGTWDGVRSGYVIGVGGEYALDDNWAIYGEYNYMNFGTERLELVDGVIYPGNWFNTYENTAQSATVGIKYKF